MFTHMKNVNKLRGGAAGQVRLAPPGGAFLEIKSLPIMINMFRRCNNNVYNIRV